MGSSGAKQGSARRWARRGGGALWKALAVLALSLPLTGVSLTRRRLVVAPLLLLVLALARLAGARPFWGVLAAAMIATNLATLDVLLSAAPGAWWRVLAAAVVLSLVFLFFFSVSGERKPQARVALGFLAVLVVVRASYAGTWSNPGVLPALLLLAPVVALRPPRPFIPIWCVCALEALFGWMGFMNMASYPGRLALPDAPGIHLDLLLSAGAVRHSGARFFQPGRCPRSRGASYVGEAERTYRIEPDGGETTFLAGKESAYNLVEVCDRDLVITGSYDGRLIRFARFGTGETIEDLPLPARPTTLLLDEGNDALFVGTAMPGGVLKIDITARRIVASLPQFLDRDPAFSGVPSIVMAEGRLYGAWSSYFIVDDKPGVVFRTDLDLGLFAPIASFRGAWGYLAPDPSRSPGESLFLRSYNKPGLFSVDLPDGPARKVLDSPRGYYYIASSEVLNVLVENHWSTGEIRGYCASPLRPAFHIETGGMGRGLDFEGTVLLTPVAAGYLKVHLPPGLCPTETASGAAL